MKKYILANVLIFAFIAFFLSGCSFSDSSYSSSSPSRSSSKHTKGSAKQVETTHSSYQEEISSLAVIYVGSQGDSQNFHRDLSQISNRHGINDWGGDRKTFLAIGRGLKRANVPKDAIQYLSFLHDVKTLSYYNAIFDGYDAE
jgi:hypothetical protein